MSSVQGHKHSGSVSQNQKAQLANAYNELGRELSSHKVRVVGNYTLGKVIGEGAYGKVRIGTHRLTSTRVAIKQIPKSMSASLTREIHHHRQLHHPHVTQMYEVIATESSIWIVTELCSGGELFDYLVEKGRLSEDETRIVFGQLCLAVAYLHEKGIVHRDLKLENVLLDERCRVKLGDFGFTREFERGSLMETFCGTTGYASPEMLQGKKYNGPEVDVWSLGIVLYCLLTGTLPFDDDDERVMREKIIIGEFEDPEWLSPESRDLIKNTLEKDSTKRLTIPQILAHPWFTSKSSDSASIPRPEALTSESSERSSRSTASASTFLSSSDAFTSPPTTPADSSDDPFDDDYPSASHHRNPSEITIRKEVQGDHFDIASTARPAASSSRQHHPETVLEEEQEHDEHDDVTMELPPRRTGSSSSRAPPIHTVRTPARTKRRSVSSILSDPASPTSDKTPTLPIPQSTTTDFVSLLSTPSPIIFSTPMERQLLNAMSILGFDLGQIVYSVLNDACDAAGAVWWMLLRKAEKKAMDDGGDVPQTSTPGVDTAHNFGDKFAEEYSRAEKRKEGRGKQKVAMGVQTDPGGHLTLNNNRSAAPPQFAVVPPTPTLARPVTPPRPTSPTRTPMLTPSSSVIVDSTKSHPSTPSGSQREASKGRKARSGSVSIMQRATTALEAAGLVRKKSSEAVRDQQEKDKERERERSREMERKLAAAAAAAAPVYTDESRTSHGSASSKLTKSPPLRPSKGPSTPPPSDLHHPQPQMGSPWVLANSNDEFPHYTRAAPPTPSNSPGGLLSSMSTPSLADDNSGSKGSGTQRNRANLLTAFRLWFHEDKKGKRKENAVNSSPSGSRFAYNRPSSGQGYASGSVKRRTSSGGKPPPRVGNGHRAHRPSVSSRRSSSVNSRRSSIASVQMIVLDSPQMPPRRSVGSHTPNSERGEFSSRPSSVKSFSQRHRKSPSASSTGSTHFRTASPMQRMHRRGGSSSSTRVVRQSSRPTHGRSDSAASSIHSPVSSRPASYIEFSESEGRTTSPFKHRTRRSADDTPRRATGNATFLQKRQGAFSSPGQGGYGNSLGRSSWKKSWGLEPPGWQTRATYLPVEVLAISPVTEGTSLRDVFTGRQSLNLGDESDWIDEDDDIPYAGGLGQMPMFLGTSSASQHILEPALTLSQPPRGHRPSKRTKASTPQPANVPASSGRKVGHSPVERLSPVPAENNYDAPETRGGRRQLPATRAGPSFKHAIQEEDEGEEE